ncbi:ribonuclease domain-containing protein [Trichormus azollae]
MHSTYSRGKRGSRRLITRQNSEIYYTVDHYNNFQEVI